MSFYEYEGPIQVHVEKIIKEGETEYRIWTNYGSGAGSFSMKELRTEEDVAASIRKRLEKDRGTYNIPDLQYDIEFRVFHIKTIRGTGEEESQTKKSIEALLENTTGKEISLS
ncbi:MAG TPA: hypothetical protein VJH92_02715 [Candidatus Nanoarchaeia archaeon]|nr:hypothetical protein [Candidatus Nanoarchaeia archaeon]